MKDLGLLTLRLIVGGLLMGHGAEKLFGAFGGHGIKGTGGFMEKLGLRPGEPYARLAGASEFGGGLLTVAGLGGPIGPISTTAPMIMALTTAHWGKPIWATEGGGELPLTNAAVGASLAMTGPGRISLDHLFGIRIPGWMTFLTVLGVAGGVAYTLMTRFLAMEAEAGSDETPELLAPFQPEVAAEEPAVEERAA
jgi:putative oxidoreductase